MELIFFTINHHMDVGVGTLVFMDEDERICPPTEGNVHAGIKSS